MARRRRSRVQRCASGLSSNAGWKDDTRNGPSSLCRGGAGCWHLQPIRFRMLTVSETMPRLKRARKASPLAGLPALHLSTYPLVLAMSYRRASRRRDYSQRRNRRRPSGRIMAKHKILRAVQFGVTRKTRFQKRFALVRDAIFELPITPAAAIRELF